MSDGGWESGACSTEQDQQRMAGELATTPRMVERLLTVHVATSDGLCAGCTTPIRGVPFLEWPCAVRRLADSARGLLRESGPR